MHRPFQRKGEVNMVGGHPEDRTKRPTSIEEYEQKTENLQNEVADRADDLGVQNSAQVGKVKPRFFTAGNMAVMGILTAIAYVLYLLPKFIPVFNLPFFPSWLDLQISDLPALLGGFAIGPLAAVIIIVVKCLLKMPFTSTTCVGELADIIIGIAFVLPAALFYKKWKNRIGAALGMLVGAVIASLIGVLANRVVLVPFYVWQFGLGDAEKGWSIILGAVGILYEGVTKESFYKFYLWSGVLPFNLLRCAISSVITYFVYKPLSKALHWEIVRKKKTAVALANADEASERITDDIATGTGEKNG